MVRRGSAVRVRKRASQKAAGSSGFFSSPTMISVGPRESTRDRPVAFQDMKTPLCEGRKTAVKSGQSPDSAGDTRPARAQGAIRSPNWINPLRFPMRSASARCPASPDRKSSARMMSVTIRFFFSMFIFLLLSCCHSWCSPTTPVAKHRSSFNTRSGVKYSSSLRPASHLARSDLLETSTSSTSMVKSAGRTHIERESLSTYNRHGGERPLSQTARSRRSDYDYDYDASSPPDSVKATK